MSLTTLILTHNNEGTLQNTLDSLSPLDINLIVGDVNSTDKTRSICRKSGAVIKTVNPDNERSYEKNELLKDVTGWILYIEPWEILAAGYEDINKVINSGIPNVYGGKVFHGESITKEIKLWHKDANIKFRNPIYETLDAEISKVLNNLIFYSYGGKNQTNNVEDKLKEWLKTSPISNEPYYYQAFFLLSKKRYKEFIPAAELYISRNSKGISAVMMRYYIASIKFHVQELKNFGEASREILTCIAANPLMAEFWCLLGDIYYAKDQYKKAKSIYENGIILGGQRSNDDLWPIEISKYKDYPEKMITSCESILNQKKYYKTS